jgi:hypothetical protein
MIALTLCLLVVATGTSAFLVFRCVRAGLFGVASGVIYFGIVAAAFGFCAYLLLNPPT